MAEPAPWRGVGAPVQSRRQIRFGLPPALGVCAALTACAPEPARDPFASTGELVALSGGDAGPDGACVTCHGLAGEGDGQAVPRLAGLPRGYLQKQLEDYAAGLRPDPAMAPIAKALDADHRASVAAYYAALPAGAPTASAGPTDAAGLYQNGDPARGLAACAECHGVSGEGGGEANPPLAGQPAAYLAEQLRRWKRAERRNDPRGVMLTIAQRLSEAEVAGLAAYAASLSGPAAPAGSRPAASPPARRGGAARDAAPSPPRASAAGPAAG